MTFILALVGTFQICSTIGLLALSVPYLFENKVRILAVYPDQDKMREVCGELWMEAMHARAGYGVACGLCGCILFVVLSI